MSPDAETVASPICCYEAPCPRAGRAVLGPPVGDDECVNRSIKCLTCGRTGIESTNLRVGKNGKKQA